jgi:hypothetical protein
MFLKEPMDIDFSALASRVAAFSDVLGCIILSNDGLVLGWFPPGDEDGVKPAWLKLAALGDPDRAFMKFSSGEVWAYVSVGPYAAFAVATGKTRPGVLLDHLEQVLLVADESREMRQVARAPDRVDLVRSTPKALADPKVEAQARPSALETPAAGEQPTPDPEPSSLEEFVPSVVPATDTRLSMGDDMDHDPVRSEPDPAEWDAPELDETEVDRVILAREFAALLQEDEPGDEELT